MELHIETAEGTTTVTLGGHAINFPEMAPAKQIATCLEVLTNNFTGSKDFVRKQTEMVSQLMGIPQ